MNITKKIGLIIKKDQKFLVVRKEGTVKFCIPGGRPERKENDLDTIQREIREELNSSVIFESIKYIGEFFDVAINEPEDIVRLKLYCGKIKGNIKPSSEIEEIRWFNPFADNYEILAPGIKEKILPVLLNSGYIKGKTNCDFTN